MGSLFSKPKATGPSAQELEAQKARQAELAREAEQAEAEESRLRQQRLSERRAVSSRQRGRLSLLAGSELGTSDKLG